VMVGYQNMKTNQIDLWASTNATDGFQLLTSPWVPFSQNKVIAHPFLRLDSNGFLYVISVVDSGFGPLLAYNAAAWAGFPTTPTNLGSYNMKGTHYTIPSSGQAISLDIQYAMDVGLNESGTVEARIATTYKAADGHFHIRFVTCQGYSTCVAVSKWDTANEPGVHDEFFPAVAYGGGKWKVAYYSTRFTDSSHLTVAYQNLVGDGSAAHPFAAAALKQAGGTITPCPRSGYWGDYNDMRYNRSQSEFVYSHNGQNTSEDCTHRTHVFEERIPL
jgi:hypothetical protein